MKSLTNSIQANAFIKVLRFRQFRSLWQAQICSQLSMNMLLFMLALQIYQNTESNAAVSGLFFFYSIPAVFFGIFAGTIMDYVDKRTVLLFSDLIRAVGVIFMYSFLDNVAVLYLLVFLNAIVTQFYVPSEAPLIPRFIPQEYILTANSMFSFTYFSSMGLGFIIAGPILKLFGIFGALLIVCLLFLFAAYNVSHIPKSKSLRYMFSRIMSSSLSSLIRRMVSELGKGLTYIHHTRTVKDALILLAITQIILAILGVLGPGFADQLLGIDVHDASVIIVGPVVLGIVLGALWLGNKGEGLRPTNVISLGVFGVGLTLIGVSVFTFFTRRYIEHVYWSQICIIIIAMLLFFILGVSNSFLDVPANTRLQQEADGSMRSRVYGLLTAVVGGIGVMPVVLGGVLADMVGVGKTVFLLGVFVMMYGVYRIRYHNS